MKNAFLVILTLSAKVLLAQNSAPSSHLEANDSGEGDILIRTVRSTITTDATYFCTMHWNAGAEGGGYCGFQDSPDKGNIFIYSIWNPSNGQPITAAYIGEGTVVEPFGGEGTGLKSQNGSIGWNLNEWNTVVTRAWNVDNHTFFGFWVKKETTNKWYHMVTMNYPVNNVRFKGQTNSFLEDWLSTGSQPRRFETKNAFKRLVDGTWKTMNQGYYTRNVEPRSSNYTNAVDAGTYNNEVFFMQSGGNTTSSFTGTLPITFSLPAGTTNSSPNALYPTIDFNIQTLSQNSVSWKVNDTSIPQFKYTVKVNNTVMASETNPQVFSASISANTGDTVEVVLEDILGRIQSQSKTLMNSALLKADNLNTTQHIIAFENPVKQNLVIKTNQKIEKIDIYSGEGKIIKTLINNTSVSELPKGVYVAKIILENKKTITKKFIKN